METPKEPAAVQDYPHPFSSNRSPSSESPPQSLVLPYLLGFALAPARSLNCRLFLQPPLVQAIFSRDVEEVRSLLSQKENINVLVSWAQGGWRAQNPGSASGAVPRLCLAEAAAISTPGVGACSASEDVRSRSGWEPRTSRVSSTSIPPGRRGVG